MLYEIGEKNAALIQPHLENFVARLNNKNNRLVWGAMTAIDALTDLNPEAVFSTFPKCFMLPIPARSSPVIMLWVSSLNCAHGKRRTPFGVSD
ncbi:MAG: hypothetical protein IPK76_01400 [Lewinellaceae bacterium]|nr:hypothetical protein [Lewinellaceae bacterium]